MKAKGLAIWRACPASAGAERFKNPRRAILPMNRLAGENKPWRSFC